MVPVDYLHDRAKQRSALPLLLDHHGDQACGGHEDDSSDDQGHGQRAVVLLLHRRGGGGRWGQGEEPTRRPLSVSETANSPTLDRESSQSYVLGPPMVVHEVAIWLTRERPKVKPSSRKYGADMCASPASSAWLQVEPHHTRSCTMSAHNQASTSDSLIERREKRHAAPT